MNDTLFGANAPWFAGLLVVVLFFAVAYHEWRKDREERATPPSPDRETGDRTHRGFLTIRHKHSLDAETVGLLGELMDRAFADYFARQAEMPSGPRAVAVVPPPEPEERIARDLMKAQTIVRGAARLQQAAQERGMYLSESDAIKQAAGMAASAFDDTN